MIYLDSAATTLQKPPSVANAVKWALDHTASPGRGGHRPAMEAAKIAFDCREEAAALFHMEDPSQVVFTFNATHGLNLAIKTLVYPGCRVVISGYEHNAVTRPLHSIPQIQIQTVRSELFCPQQIIQGFRDALEQGADVAICTHVSNVFGFVLPIEEIAALCKVYEVPLIIDASQSAGVLPIDVPSLGAAFIAMPGHKGLYGPQGTGLLLCAQMLPQPLIEGGTGSSSRQQAMPDVLPDRLEAGTHNIPGIAGLLQGIRYVRRKTPEKIAIHERMLIYDLKTGLKQWPMVEVFAAGEEKNQVGVLSIRIRGRDCEEVGDWLAHRGIAVRAGLHCAPTAHESAGTLETGTIRFSVSAFNTRTEIGTALSALRPMFD